MTHLPLRCLIQFGQLWLINYSYGDLIILFFPFRNDPRLYKDDVDIRFSKTLNSCKLPQIRYASPERLFERLTDLRFLSIDFLNTFLLTYRVFTDGVTVLEALKKVHYSPENQLKNWSPGDADAPSQVEASSNEFEFERRISSSSMGDLPQHRESVVSTSSDSQVQMIQHQQQKMIMNKNSQHWRLSHRKCKWPLQQGLVITGPFFSPPKNLALPLICLAVFCLSFFSFLLKMNCNLFHYS